MQRLSSFFQPDTSHLNTIEVKKDALLNNLSHLQSLQPNDGIFPVLKSNAYGHGLKQVSKLLNTVTVPYICVDSFHEYEIVKQYTNHNILLIGETHPDNYRLFDTYRTTFAVHNLATILFLSNQKIRCKVHLFLNTGMNREGIQPQELDDVLTELLKAPHITVEGVMSHLANADKDDTEFNQTQLDRFKQMSQKIKETGFFPKRFHLGNSGGIAKLNDPLLNGRRTGIGFYGYNHLDPSDPAHSKLIDLQPALRVMSSVVSLQEIAAGDTVSYGGTYTATEDELIATLPFGYYEGLPRAVSNNWKVRWNDERLPLRGRVCMNLCSVGTAGHQIPLGDHIELIGSDPTAPNSIAALAEESNTIPYEVLVRFSETIPRLLK